MKYYENLAFPPQAKAVLDVTKAPYFLDPTGKEDCTQKLKQLLDDILINQVKAIQYVYNTLRDAPRNTRLNVSNRKSGDRIFAVDPVINPQLPIIYFPNGTYLVSDTVTYTLRELHNMMYHCSPGGFELNRGIRMAGQSREGTIIKLKDHCPGYEYGQERAVINLMLGERSNVSMSNYVENLTIDVGKGNPGAVGLVYFVNNAGAIRNVTIKSSDENHEGAIGLLIRGEHVSGCNSYSLTVDGFKYGVLITSFRTHTYFENITLKNQQKYGMKIDNNATQIIGLKAETDVPAVFVAGPMAHVVLTDADIVSKGTQYTAIKYELGCIYMRNVRTKGFHAAFDKNWLSFTIPDGYIEEYCNLKTHTLFDEEARSINLKVPPVPDVALEPDFNQWLCVNDMGAVGDGVHDDTEAISAAFASGKPVIYFQPGRYVITRPIDIPASVKHIHFMFCDLVAGEELCAMDQDAVFRITGESDEVLLIEKLFSWYDCMGWMRMFRHDCKRTVYIRDMHVQGCAFYFNTVPGAEVFFENCANTIAIKDKYGSIPSYEFNGQTVWCHSINPERSRIKTINRGGTMWWSGFKTEQEGAINVTTDGGVTEILGGVAVSGDGGSFPLIDNRDSNVSAIFATSGVKPASVYPIAVREMRGGEEKFIRDTELPQRYAPWYYMPLYSGRGKKTEDK